MPYNEVILNSVPEGHDPVLWRVAMSARDIARKKYRKKHKNSSYAGIDYSKEVKQAAKLLKLRGEL